MSAIEILSAAPMSTVQDAGRNGMLRHGIAASGPMDRGAYQRAGSLLGGGASTCIEFGAGRMTFRLTGGSVKAAFCGGNFSLDKNGGQQAWESLVDLHEGDEITVSPGAWGNFGLVRFDQLIDLPEVLGSRSTNLIAKLGGLDGRTLRAGDRLKLVENDAVSGATVTEEAAGDPEGPIRVIWGIHAELFSNRTRDALLSKPFKISAKLDRMGMQLIDSAGVFSAQKHLSLVSDVVVPGDIQILGNGTPVVLMRDHQPTGGYPRIATVIGSDLDRLAQMRPGAEVRFASVTVDSAQVILRAGDAA